MLTRRGILLATAGCAWAQNHRTFPSERKKYADPATEFDVYRVTDATHASILPPPGNHIFSRRGNFLLHASDRAGSMQAFAVDLKSWQLRQLTETPSLDISTLTLTADERNLCYVSEGALRMIAVSGALSKEREMHKLSGELKPGHGLAAIPDGPSCLFAEEGTRLMSVNLLKAGVSKIAENNGGVYDPMPRPHRASVLYRTESTEWWLAHLDGSKNFKLKMAAGGALGPARWSPDGKTILYLHFPSEPGKSNALREHNPDSGEDRQIASTSGYVGFSPNADASVFVGASRNKTGPFVLLMLRVTRRELALCEHRSSDPAKVSPVFSPDSQKVFFQSDRHGKPAIYSIHAEKLVEKTESEGTTGDR